MSASQIRVLIVDDSAFARKVIREVLAADPAIEIVGIARDGLEALEKIEELRPDVVTLDLIMPDLDGLGVLRALPRDGAPRVVIVSVSGSDSELAIEALQMGAFDLVTKPTPLPTDRMYELARELVTKVKAAGAARSKVSAPCKAEATVLDQPPPLPPSRPTSCRLVVIGTSTGGPQALTQFFKALPAGFPVPIAVALHIPAGYTEPLAARISKISPVPLEEAYNGMEIMPGQAVIAPGGMHLQIISRAGRLYAAVAREPVESIYHPSVNLLFESAASQIGSQAIGIVMTGMGNDGMEGARAMREKGGRILAESAGSCVVYGMPRSVIEADLANEEALLERLPALLTNYIYRV